MKKKKVDSSYTFHILSVLHNISQSHFIWSIAIIGIVTNSKQFLEIYNLLKFGRKKKLTVHEYTFQLAMHKVYYTTNLMSIFQKFMHNEIWYAWIIHCN